MMYSATWKTSCAVEAKTRGGNGPMSVKTLAWKLASPYDAYVSHVARLNDALRRVQELSKLALAYEAGLHGSVRFVPGSGPADRSEQLRQQLAEAAAEMDDQAFEEFVLQLGGGEKATVEGDRARAVRRLSHTTRGIADYFAIAASELSLLEERGYTPSRPDVARQLEQNHLPSTNVAEYRRTLRELGSLVGQSI